MKLCCTLKNDITSGKIFLNSISHFRAEYYSQFQIIPKYPGVSKHVRL